MTSNDLSHALDAIEQRVEVIRRSPDCIEYLTRTRYWIEIMTLPEGWRTRAYRAGTVNESLSSTVSQALDAARQMAKGGAQHP